MRNSRRCTRKRAEASSARVGPNTAFVLLILGALSIYAELLRPGLFAPGILGLGSMVAGGYFLFRPPLSALGIGLLVAGILLMIGEAWSGPYLLLGSLGTVALTAGFCLVCDGPPRIEPELAVPVCLVFGTCTMVLAASAKRARRNKWSDLGGAK